MPVLLLGIGLFFVSLILLKFALTRRKLFFWLIFSFCLFFSLVFMHIGYALADYRIVKVSDEGGSASGGKERVLAAVIECRKVTGKIYDMEFLIKYADAKDNNLPEKFLLTGNQWSIQGKILLIKPLFGSNAGYYLYKITRINARFLNPRNADESPQLAYNINRTDRLWDFFKKHNFNFIKAISTTTKYRRADKASPLKISGGSTCARLCPLGYKGSHVDKFNLYLTSSGFDIKKSK